MQACETQSWPFTRMSSAIFAKKVDASIRSTVRSDASVFCDGGTVPSFAHNRTILSVLCIIGAGNVVQHKLLPALAWLGVDLKGLRIYGTHDDPQYISTAGARLTVSRHHPNQFADIAASTDLIPWLALPPINARRDLLDACRERKVVCEKPVGTSRDDLKWLEENRDALVNTFVLSYYVQERLAPAFWLTGALKPPAILLTREVAHLEAGPDLVPRHAELILSETFVRTGGDTVSTWQQGDGIQEFAVHAPAILAGLGLAADSCHRATNQILFTGPRSRAIVTRPGPNRKTLTITTENGTCYADGQNRTARVTGGAAQSASIYPACPPYVAVTAYVMEWLNGGSYCGDGTNQLHALRLLTHLQEKSSSRV